MQHPLAHRAEQQPGELSPAPPADDQQLGLAGRRGERRDRPAVHVPAVKVDVVDTTAAGDAFTAALAVAWGEGRELVEAVHWAAAAGAACVRKLGASVALPRRVEIDELFSRPA